ncbi:MAG: hypothetical protein Fur0012_13610 [Elusimicrobiota bacterium]
MEKLELFKKGCLGTCWYGKYHYLEPWAGCEHECFYCYARFRGAVKSGLKKIKASFSTPKTLFPRKELLKKIKSAAFSGRIKIVKLSRFTDIFTPRFVASGLSFEILDILSASPVERIIITTKGVPSPQILSLMESRPHKFSYNFAVRPSNSFKLEENILEEKLRLSAASRAASSGILTTAHLDPFIATVDDGPCLGHLLKRLKKSGIKRAMFSYLLVSREILNYFEKKLGRKKTLAIEGLYDFSMERKYLPGQEDTFYFSLKPEVKAASVKKTARALRENGFEFVLCSLKSARGASQCGLNRENICDGKFYA